ncbi:hypothetical protein [Aestuariivirga litoralis]|uniref:hypothetical protein n=1 Tax=Aestuariivirga litoralis TaxID=2650924 RepID=UPI0011B7B752|nr:hypothetical protein [Aestuariivirga litoralis]
MKRRLAAVAVFLLLSPVAEARDRVVDCAILSLPGKAVQFKGKCNFMPEAGGSFSLADADGKPKLYGDIGVVSVTLTGKDTAEVSGLVIDSGGGHSSRWGTARRAADDRACWDGEDFRICAW